MPSAGALCPPLITPLRKTPDRIQLPVNHIDTSTLVELSTEVSCKIFFTTDGTKPCPFQRKVGGREVTFKYIAPFTLKPGKRVLKAVCTTRDGLQESAVVTKTFNVDDANLESGETTDGYDYTSYSSFFETSDTDTSKSTVKSKRRKHHSPPRKPRNLVTKEAWASDGDNERRDTGATGEPGYPPIPDGPFNPTNYSGTQINVWGGQPPGAWPGLNAQPGTVVIGGTPQPPYPVQYGYLTEQMIDKVNAPNRPVTVRDLRELMEEGRKKAKTPPPAQPAAIEYKPVYQDPPLEPVSPGKGDFKGNLLHIYAHMLEHAKSNGDFRLRVAEPRIGKVLEGKFEDEGDGYRLSLVLSKPGVPRESTSESSSD